MKKSDYPPLVLIHAFPLSGSMWKPQTQTLGKLTRIIAPDLPGFGRSKRQSPTSIAGMARFLKRFLDKSGVRGPVVICGLSMGGYVALEFWRQFPDRVRALGLFSTRPGSDTPEQKKGRFSLVRSIKKEGLAQLAGSFPKKSLGATTQKKNPRLAAQIRRAVRSARPEGVADALVAMARRRDNTALLKKIKCPVLIIAGNEDAVIPPDEARAMNRAIPRSALHLLPRAGHLANLEAPEAFNRLMAGWIRELPPVNVDQHEKK